MELHSSLAAERAGLQSISADHLAFSGSTTPFKATPNPYTSLYGAPLRDIQLVDLDKARLPLLHDYQSVTNLMFSHRALPLTLSGRQLKSGCSFEAVAPTM